VQRATSRRGKSVSVAPSPTSTAVEQGAHSLDAETGTNPTQSGAVDPKQKRIHRSGE